MGWRSLTVAAALVLSATGGAHAGTVRMETLAPAYAPTQATYSFDCQTARLLTISGRDLAVGDTALADGMHTVRVRATPGQTLRWRVDGVEHHAQCLPTDFPQITFTRHTAPTSDYYALTPTSGMDRRYMLLLDATGVPVWWLRDDGRPRDLKLLDADTLAYTISGNGRNGWYRLVGWDGTERLRLGAELGVGQHDLQPTARGTFLINRHVPAGCPQVVGDCIDLTPWGGGAQTNPLQSEIVEFDATGRLIATWSTRGRTTLGEAARWVASQQERITHLNSIEPDGDGVIFTLRHTDAVYRIDWTTGDIQWKLGGTVTPQSLTVTGDPLAPAIFGGPHDVRVLGRMGPVTRISVSDNGTNLARRPRAVVYDIDAAAGTATFVEDVRMPEDAAPTSRCCGSSRRLPDGGWVMTFGDNPTVSEIAPDGSERARITFGGGLTSYRAVPVLQATFRRSLADAMRSGMQAMYGEATAEPVSSEPLARPLDAHTSDAAPTGPAATQHRRVVPLRPGMPTVVDRPRPRTTRADVRIAFRVPPDTRPQCSLNGREWRPCTSPLRIRTTRTGPYTVRIRSRAADGTTSPVTRVRWRVIPG